jgi:hypothetical protein
MNDLDQKIRQHFRAISLNNFVLILRIYLKLKIKRKKKNFFLKIRV